MAEGMSETDITTTGYKPFFEFADIDPTIGKIEPFKNTPFGLIRTLTAVSRVEWLFVGIVAVGIVCTTVFSIYFICTEADRIERYVFAWLVLINILFVAHYLVSGVLTERLSEMAIIIVGTVMILLYAVINFTTSPYNGVKLARMIVACVLGAVIIVLGVYVAYLCNKNCFIFRVIGANSDMVWKVKVMFVYHSLMKFDLQLGMSLAVVVINHTSLDAQGIAVIVMAIVAVIGWSVLGYFAVRLENKVMLWVYVGISSAAILAFIIWQSIVGKFKSKLIIAGFSLVSTAVVICHVSIIILSPFVSRYFGLGIKEILYEEKSPDEVIQPAAVEKNDDAIGSNTNVA